jgi:predicted transposase/invertase (TIGR01784 family)
LPRTVIISIVDFKLFDCAEFHSQFRALEVTRHTLLTDKMSLHYFELPKLPKTVNADNGLELWLSLFNAETEEELKLIKDLEAPIMEQAISAYRHITAKDEFKEIERLYSLARHNEASALRHAAQVATEKADAKWKGVVADKDAALADKDAALAAALAELERLRAQ